MELAKSASQIGKLLKEARESAGLTQEEAAAAVGVKQGTYSRWERGIQRTPGAALLALSPVFKKPLAFFGEEAERLGEKVPRGALGPSQRRVAEPGGPSYGEWEPNPVLATALPRRVYEVAIGYCRRLAAAGLPRDEVDEAERMLIDSDYAKLNRRLKREVSEDEQIRIIDATWGVMQEVLSWKGVRA